MKTRAAGDQQGGELAIEIEWKTAPAAEAKKSSERNKVTLSRIGKSVSKSKSIRLLVANMSTAFVLKMNSVFLAYVLKMNLKISCNVHTN